MFARLLKRSLKPSTLVFWQAARRRSGYSLFDLIHGYVYTRWPYLYIGIGVGEHPWVKVLRPIWGVLARLRLLIGLEKNTASLQPSQALTGTGTAHLEAVSFADTYHGKVLPLETAKTFVSIKAPIRVGDLEQVIPYKLARELVLEHPDHIAVLECPCRQARQSPCLPLDVCLLIGEPFASMVTEQHPTRSRWIESEEAIKILEAEEERGHVHHAFFKDAMLGRFYAICNCCACCCGALQAHRNGTPMLASSGYIAQVDEVFCQGCGICEAFCQFSAITVQDGLAVVDFEACMGCGICASHCQNEALGLVAEPAKGVPLEICDWMFDLVNPGL